MVSHRTDQYHYWAKCRIKCDCHVKNIACRMCSECFQDHGLTLRQWKNHMEGFIKRENAIAKVRGHGVYNESIEHMTPSRLEEE